MADPRPLTRKELSQFLPSERAIRAFEKLFDLVPSALDLRYSTVVIGGTHTTSGNETIICVGPVTVILQSVDLADGTIVTIKRLDSTVTVQSNTTIEGVSEDLILRRDGTSVDLYYSSSSDGWWIV